MLGLLGFFEKKNRHDAESFEKAKKGGGQLSLKTPIMAFSMITIPNKKSVAFLTTVCDSPRRQCCLTLGDTHGRQAKALGRGERLIS